MNRAAFLVSATLLLQPSSARADFFDNYTNQILARISQADGVKKIDQLTPEMMVEHRDALPGIRAAFVVVKTNEGEMCRMLVQPARQKISKDKSVPILLIERFVTFWEEGEQAVHAKGKNVRLFANFSFNLGLGQVVPASVPADLRFVAEGDKLHIEPVGKAEMYLVTKHLVEASPKASARPAPGAAFGPQFFNGAFKLYDDGRRSGTLRLKVNDEGEVNGHYYSDKDGQKYEVAGKIGTPSHSVQFRITYPKTIQFFHGWMFTADGQVLTGYARLEERETGFYAVRE